MASAVVFGATGLVGEALLAELSVANQVTSIVSYGRRDPSHQCPNCVRSMDSLTPWMLT